MAEGALLGGGRGRFTRRRPSMEATLKKRLFSGKYAEDIILGTCIADENPFPSMIICKESDEIPNMVVFDWVKTIGTRPDTSINMYTNKTYNISICLKIETYLYIDKIIEIIHANPDLCKNIVPITYLGRKNGKHYSIMPVMNSLYKFVRSSASIKPFDRIFSILLQQLKNISKIVVSTEYRESIGDHLIYSDLKISNILVCDNEPYLCDIESFGQLGGCMFMPCTLPESINIDDITLQLRDSTGLMSIDLYKYDVTKNISFQLGGMLVNLLFSDYHKKINYIGIENIIKFIKQHWKVPNEEMLKMVKNIQIDILSTLMDKLKKFLGFDIANLLNPDPLKRTDLNDIDEINFSINSTSFVDIFYLIGAVDCEGLLDVVGTNPKIILQRDRESDIPLLKALRYYNESDNQSIKDQYDKIINILIDTELCDSNDVKNSINYKEVYFGMSPLFYACEQKMIKWVHRFIKLGGDVNFVRDWNNTSLKQLATDNDIDLSVAVTEVTMGALHPAKIMRDSDSVSVATEGALPPAKIMRNSTAITEPLKIP